MRPTDRKNPITADAVRANAGIQAEYQHKLEKLVQEMAQAVAGAVLKTYATQSPSTGLAADSGLSKHDFAGLGFEIGSTALDAAPVKKISEVIAALSQEWLGRIDGLAPKLAEHFAKAAAERSSAALKASLKKSGFAVDFKFSKPYRAAVDAVISENVGLIRSIGQQHLTEVQGLVMRSIAAGRDVGGLAEQLEQRYEITRRRARLIAKDQNNKATAVITRVRQKEAGITEAIWRHSYAGKTWRASHVKADGKRYKIDEGCKIDGEYILPGEKINCRCYCKSVLPGM